MINISRTTEYRAYSFTYYYLGKVCVGLAENVLLC